MIRLNVTAIFIPLKIFAERNLIFPSEMKPRRSSSTQGSRGEISEEMLEVINYLKDERITGEFSQALDDAVNAVKASEERRREYMIFNMHDNEVRAEGRAEGLEEGLEKGREKGREEGQNQFGKLILALLNQGRTEDATRASSDPEYRDQLYREFQIA